MESHYNHSLASFSFIVLSKKASTLLKSIYPPIPFQYLCRWGRLVEHTMPTRLPTRRRPSVLLLHHTVYSLSWMTVFTPHPFSSNYKPSLHSNSVWREKTTTIRRAFPNVPPSHLATFYLCFHLFHLPLCYSWTVHVPNTSLSHLLDPISFQGHDSKNCTLSFLQHHPTTPQTGSFLSPIQQACYNIAHPKQNPADSISFPPLPKL